MNEPWKEWRVVAAPSGVLRRRALLQHVGGSGAAEETASSGGLAIERADQQLETAQTVKALQKVKCCFLQQNGNYEAAALRSRNEPVSEELKAARKLIRALKKELFPDRN